MRVGIVVFAIALGGCAAEEAGSDDCVGAKCDTPGGPSQGYCPERKRDALDDNTPNFTAEALRWECKDVSGVTPEDYGQEYCEFFALVEPPDGEPVALGRRLDGSATNRTPASLELTTDQIFAIEDAPDAIYGHCIFTSWFSDSKAELSGQIGSVSVSANVFRTKLQLNSAAAAIDLFERCAAPDKQPDIGSAFESGCAEAAELFDTGWRRSDPTVCAAAMQMADCGCSADGGLVDNILPQFPGPDAPAWQSAGLPLGSWASRTGLPPGCQPVATAGGENIVVACELSGAQIIDNQLDMISACNSLYAGNVVVHVPVPQSRITCDPGCGATPWVVED